MPDSLDIQDQDRDKTSPLAKPGSVGSPYSRAKWIMAVLVACIAVGTYVAWQYYSVREKTDDAQINGNIIPVSARVSGTIQKVSVEENQFVKAGTVLFEIDTTDYGVALERARADLAEAESEALAARSTVSITSTTSSNRLSAVEAALQVARAGVSTARKAVDAARAQADAAKAQVRQAEANHTRASQDLERYRLLVEKDQISKQQYDAAAANETAGQAAVDSAKAALVAAAEGIAVAESNLEQAKARIAQAEAEVRTAGTVPEQVAVATANASKADAKVLRMRAALNQEKLNLQYTTVRAPVDGIVSKKNVQIGMNVQPGQSLLAMIPPDDIWVTANFKETQLEEMRPGQKAVISVDTYGGRKYDGQVESIAAATGAKFSLLPPENATGNFVKVVQRVPVRLRIEQGQDQEDLLRPGMSAVVTIFTK